MKRLSLVTVMLLLLVSTLLIGCASTTTDAPKESTINIKPSHLFQGDLERLQPHLGIIGGLVEVDFARANSAIHTKYEIWEKGKLIESHNSFSIPVEEKFSGEVSVSLKTDVEDPAMFEMCTGVYDKKVFGGSNTTPLPRFSKEFSYMTNELHSEIQIPAGQEVAVWGLMAAEPNKPLRTGDIEETAREADWALVLKIAVKD